MRTPRSANQTAASSRARLALEALSSGTWATYARRVCVVDDDLEVVIADGREPVAPGSVERPSSR